jgi:hypothetical protein
VSTPIQPEDIRKGDLIRLEHTKPEHTHAVEYRAAFPGERNYSGAEVRYFLLDRPKPPVVLPTEPGVYTDKQGDVWLVFDGSLRCLESPADTKNASSYAPFTKLEPVADTAARVLNALAPQIQHPADNRLAMAAVAAEFGAIW